MKKTKKQLKAEIKALKANRYAQLHKSYKDIEKASKKVLLGSSAILEIRFLDNTHLVYPTEIIDGLSEETIKVFKKDIKRSQDLQSIGFSIRD